MREEKYGAFLFGLALVMTTSVAMADDDERVICNGGAQPILSVSDFDGNGVVDDNDMVLISNAEERENYYAFYDVNVDGELNKKDIKRAQMDMGLQSTMLDRQLALLFHRVKQHQLVDSKQEVQAMGYFQLAYSLAGHGEHWTNIVDGDQETFLRPEGLNVSKDGKSVKGVYWAYSAIPVFENGATDFPTPGGLWETQKVVAFAGQPPKFTDSPDETWHTHAGLCITVEMTGTGPELVLNQHTTFAECQLRPSLAKDPNTGFNLWSNIWMLHAWMFDLNPEGVFANTHACVDPDSPPEHTINGDREVPPFFQHH